MPDYIVTALSLNLRSAPDPDKPNIRAALPQGHPVEKIGDAERPGWVEVKTRLSGVEIVGFLNGAYLAKAGATPQTESLDSGRLPRADLGWSAHATRANPASRAHAIGEPGRPGLPSTHGSGPVAGVLRVLDWLDVGDVSRHLRWKPGGNATFCNIYVYDVCCLTGPYLPRVWWTSSSIVKLHAGQNVPVKYAETVEELAANYIFNWLIEFGASFGWRRLFSADELQSEVNKNGTVGIICAQRTNMNSPGHIQIVAPEHGDKKAKRVGGKVTQPLQSNAGASNFTYGHLGSNWWQGANFRDFGFWTNASG